MYRLQDVFSFEKVFRANPNVSENLTWVAVEGNGFSQLTNGKYFSIVAVWAKQVTNYIARIEFFHYMFSIFTETEGRNKNMNTFEMKHGCRFDKENYVHEKKWAQRTWNLLDYTVIMNEICFGESWSLPSLFTIFNPMAFSLIICMTWQETQPNLINAVTVLVFSGF